jgi:hypothetical protein
MNCPLMDKERQPSKNRPSIFLTPYQGFSFAKEPFKKEDV